MDKVKPVGTEKKIKEYLVDPKILSKPIPEEKLFLYLAVSDTTQSLVLVRIEGPTYLSIYYVS